jgi:pyruvate oxidase
MTRTVAAYVGEQLQAWGVDTVFGVAGSDIIGLLNALERLGGIDFYSVHHEEVAVFMASAYAQLTGQLGVVLAHSGPGAAHLVNGLYNANLDRVPVLAVTGQVPLSAIGTTRSQSVSLERMLAPATAFTATVVHPDSIGEVLAQALETAVGERRAVHLAIPADLQERATAALLHGPGPTPRFDRTPDPDGIRQAAQLLSRARSPLILAGRGARGVSRSLLAIAEALEAPILVSLPGKGVVPEDHRLVLGPLGEAGTAASAVAARRADTLLTVASTWWPEPTSAFPRPPAAAIQVDQDPGVIGVRYPVGIGLAGAAEEVVPAVLSALGPRRPRRRRRLEQVMRVREAWRDQPHPDTEDAFHPRTVLHAIQQALPDDAIVAIDTGAHTLWTGGFYRARSETFLLSGWWRTMGYGFPAAMAAKIARPESMVLAIVGDGGLAMALSDLTTAARYRLPLVVVVFDNGSLAMEVATAHGLGQEAVAMRLENPDFAATAAAAGWVGRRLHPGDNLEAAVREALEADLPVLLQVPVRDLPPPFLEPGR